MNASKEFLAIQTERLLLLSPSPEDAPRMLAYYERNREHLAPWSATPPDGFYTEKFWRERLEIAQKDFKEGRSMRLALYERDEVRGTVIGQCEFTAILRGPFQACYLGYSLDGRAEGRGLMFEALVAAIDYAFYDLRLHRIMANYMPHNRRSGRLLEKLGFVIEGYARDYLFIAGKWQDHVMTALVNPRFEFESGSGADKKVAR